MTDFTEIYQKTFDGNELKGVFQAHQSALRAVVRAAEQKILNDAANEASDVLYSNEAGLQSGDASAQAIVPNGVTTVSTWLLAFARKLSLVVRYDDAEARYMHSMRRAAQDRA